VNVEKTKVRPPSALQIAVGQKQPENVEYFSCSATVAKNVVRCTPEVKSRSVIRKAAVNKKRTAISDFRREVDENCSLQGYCAASIGNFLQTFREKLSIPSSGSIIHFFLTPYDGTDRLSRNVGYKLPLLGA